MDQIIIIGFFYLASALAFIFLVWHVRKSIFTYSTIVLGFLSLYALLFAQYLSAPDVGLWIPGDKQTLGQFGDFIGGVLNPLLTFTTVMILMWNNKQERAEKEQERKEKESLQAQAIINKMASDLKNRFEQDELKKRYEKEAERTERQLQLAEAEFHLRQIYDLLNFEFAKFEEAMLSEFNMNFDIVAELFKGTGVPLRNTTSLNKLISLFRNGNVLGEAAHTINVEFLESNNNYEPKNSKHHEIFDLLERIRFSIGGIDLFICELFMHSTSESICLRWKYRFETHVMRAAQAGAISVEEADDYTNEMKKLYDQKFPRVSPSSEQATQQSDQA